MIIVCRNCGYPNKVKNVSFKTVYLRAICEKCGSETFVATGTVGDTSKWKAEARRGEGDLSSLLFMEEEPGSKRVSGHVGEGTLQTKTFSRSMAILLIFIVIPVLISTFNSLYNHFKTASAVNTAMSYVVESDEVETLTGSDISMELRRVKFTKTGDDVEWALVELKVAGSDGAGIVVINMEKKEDEWAVTSARFIDTASRRAHPLAVP